MRRHLLPALTILCATALAPAASAASKPCRGADAIPGTVSASTTRSATLCLINRERTKRKRKKLHNSSSLRKAAQRFSGQMVDRGFFDHVSPTGSTLLGRVKAVRYVSTRYLQWTAGENIGYGTGSLATPAEMVTAWMHSSGHRRNILDKTYRDIGIGVTEGTPDGEAERGGATYVTDFGRRRR